MKDIKVLVIDDDLFMREILGKTLRKTGFIPVLAENGENAIEIAYATIPDVVIVDLNLPGMNGIETSRILKNIDPHIELIMLTGEPSLESSVEAHHEQFFDYLVKPVQMNHIVNVVTQAFHRRKLIRENLDLIRQLNQECEELQSQVDRTISLLEDNLELTKNFIGESPSLFPLRQMILNVAPSDLNVLIRGESGTGKEIIAHMVHEISGRKKKGNYVKINCPAIPENLLESEMFGHESGAFTGADKRKKGRFELAGEGTIFLDEIGDLPMSLQSKLLQALENKEYTAVGGTSLHRIQARVVAATNAPLERMIAEGKFRSDLFYRLNQYPIHIPPLRDRLEDVPRLVNHFISRYSGDKKNRAISPMTVSRMTGHGWPGNVRELKFLIDRFMLTGDEQHILDYLPEPRMEDISAKDDKNMDGTEVTLFLTTLNEVHWNLKKAAEKLGISYTSFRRRLKKYNLGKHAPPDAP